MRRRAFVLVLAALSIVSVSADRLELANGDVVSGTIVSIDEQTVVIRTGYGTLSIDRSAVVRGEFGRAAETAAAALAADERSEAAAQTAPDPDPDPDLLFHFTFDGTLGDETGAYTLVNNGLRFAADRDGNPRSALRSDGSGAYLSLATDETLNRMSLFTLSFRIRIEPDEAVRYLVSKWTRADGEQADGKFTLQTSSGGLTLFLVGPDGRYHWLAARAALEASVWHTVAVSFAGGRAAIYVDGVEVARRTFTFSELMRDESPLLFMTAEASTADSFGRYNAAGTIDEVRLYTRGLSAEEIARLAAVDRPEQPERY